MRNIWTNQNGCSQGGLFDLEAARKQNVQAEAWTFCLVGATRKLCLTPFGSVAGRRFRKTRTGSSFSLTLLPPTNSYTKCRSSFLAPQKINQ